MSIPLKLHIIILKIGLEIVLSAKGMILRLRISEATWAYWGACIWTSSPSTCVSQHLGSRQVHVTLILQMPALFFGLTVRLGSLHPRSIINLLNLASFFFFIYNDFYFSMSYIWNWPFNVALHFTLIYRATVCYFCFALATLARQSSRAVVIPSVPGS